MDLLDLHPEEVARQLTLIEFNLFAKIEVCVCTNKLLVLLSLCNVWSALNCWGRVYQEWLQAKNINNETAPNISALIQRFNEVWNQTRISILRVFLLETRLFLQVSRWVSSSIVLVENLDLRVVVMNRFILIACVRSHQTLSFEREMISWDNYVFFYFD